MERSHQKIVKFIFCNWCVNKNTDEINEPCAECLENPVNWDSVRPIHFEPNNTNVSTKVEEYCENDILATEAVFNARKADFEKKEKKDD